MSSRTPQRVIGDGERLVFYPAGHQDIGEVREFFDNLVSDYYNGISENTPLVGKDLQGSLDTDEDTIHKKILGQISNDLTSLGRINNSGVIEFKSIRGRSTLLTTLGISTIYFAEAAMLFDTGRPPRASEHIQQQLPELTEMVHNIYDERQNIAQIQSPNDSFNGLTLDEMKLKHGENTVRSEIEDRLYEARGRGFYRPHGAIALTQVVADLYHLNRLVDRT